MVDMGGCWPTCCGGGGGGGERERGGGKRERKRGKEKERLMFVYRNKLCIVDRVISNATLISNVLWLRKRAQNFASPNFCHTVAHSFRISSVTDTMCPHIRGQGTDKVSIILQGTNDH